MKTELNYPMWPASARAHVAIVRFDDAQHDAVYSLDQLDYPLTVEEPSWQGNHLTGTLTRRHGRHPQSKWCIMFALRRMKQPKDYRPRTTHPEYWAACGEYSQTICDLLSAGF